MGPGPENADAARSSRSGGRPSGKRERGGTCLERMRHPQHAHKRRWPGRRFGMRDAAENRRNHRPGRSSPTPASIASCDLSSFAGDTSSASETSANRAFPSGLSRTHFRADSGPEMLRSSIVFALSRENPSPALFSRPEPGPSGPGLPSQPMSTVGQPRTIAPPWSQVSPSRAAGRLPIRVVTEPMAIRSGGPTQVAMSVDPRRRHAADQHGRAAGRQDRPADVGDRRDAGRDHRADVHVTDARGGHTHRRPSLPYGDSASVSRSAVSLRETSDGQACWPAATSRPIRRNAACFSAAFSGSLMTAASVRASATSWAVTCSAGATGGQMGRRQAAAAEVGGRGGAAGRSAEPGRLGRRERRAPLLVLRVEHPVSRRIQRRGRRRRCIRTRDLRDATAGPPDRLASGQGMSQDLHGIGTQLALDQAVEVLAGRQPLGQQPECLLAQPGALGDLRRALAGEFVDHLRRLALVHRETPIVREFRSTKEIRSYPRKTLRDTKKEEFRNHD